MKQYFKELKMVIKWIFVKQDKYRQPKKWVKPFVILLFPIFIVYTIFTYIKYKYMWDEEYLTIKKPKVEHKSIYYNGELSGVKE